MRERRARLSKAAMARQMVDLVDSKVAQSTITRWETGERVPGALAYRAYIKLAGAALPRDIGGGDPRASVRGGVSDMERRMQRVEEELFGGTSTTTPPLGPPTDLKRVSQAAKEVGVVIQSIYNWTRRNEIYYEERDDGKYVSVSQVLDVARRKGLLKS